MAVHPWYVTSSSCSLTLQASGNREASGQMPAPEPGESTEPLWALRLTLERLGQVCLALKPFLCEVGGDSAL